MQWLAEDFRIAFSASEARENSLSNQVYLFSAQPIFSLLRDVKEFTGKENMNMQI